MGKSKILLVLSVIIATVFYVGVLIGSLYLGEYLYNDFGLGGLLLMCCVLVLGAMGTYSGK